MIFRARDLSCLLAADGVSFQYDICWVLTTTVVSGEPEQMLRLVLLVLNRASVPHSFAQGNPPLSRGRMAVGEQKDMRNAQ